MRASRRADPTDRGPSKLDYEALSREVLRALRGKRSQLAFSRRLGYASNVAYTWEAGRRFPTASETLRVAARVGVDVRGALIAFLHRWPDELVACKPASPELVAALLRLLRGPAPMRSLAERVGVSRSVVSRLLSGQTEPRLPLFLRFIDVATRRVLDLLSDLVDLEQVPAARDEWRRLQNIRRLSAADPLFETVPRALELDAYTEHRAGWIAERLGISREEEDRTLEDLRTAGLIRWDGARWTLDRERSIDIARLDRAAAGARRAHWANVAAARMRADPDGGSFAYLVFTTDEATLAALRQLLLDYFRALRALVASSPRNTRIALANMHLLTIDVDET